MTASNPFNVNNWGTPPDTGGDDAGDDVTLGQHNTLTGGDNGAATSVENSANVNFTLGGLNHATGTVAVGVFGQSDGKDGGGVGVLGACEAGTGVCGLAMVQPVTALPSSVGVFGAGDFHGVYGVSGAVASHQPDLKTLGITTETVAVVGANGTIIEVKSDGTVVSGTANAPAILGLNGILADDLGKPKPNSFLDVAADIIKQPNGVEGVSVKGTGVVGISFADGPEDPGSDLPVVDPLVSQQLDSVKNPIPDPTDPNPTHPDVTRAHHVLPAGVVGLATGFAKRNEDPRVLRTGGPGVRGISAFDRGGIFQSATGITHTVAGTTQPSPPIAQIRLVPFSLADIHGCGAE